MATKIDTLTEVLEHTLERAKEVVAEFAQKLTTEDDPLHQFEWGKEAFEAAATVRVFTRVLASLKKEIPLKKIHNACLEETVRHAKHPKMSTSPASNLASLYEGSAYAEVTELLGGALEE